MIAPRDVIRLEQEITTLIVILLQKMKLFAISLFVFSGLSIKRCFSFSSREENQVV